MPVQLTFRDMPPSPAVAHHVARRAEKLETFHARVVGISVVIEEPHRHARHGSKYRVRIAMPVPGREIVVSRANEDEQSDVHVLIEAAFDDAERLLEADAKRWRSSYQKTHLRPAQGTVRVVFHDRGYGFLVAEDGHEVYFHENAVLNGHFADVVPGAHVKFAEEDGEHGPQASSVHVPPRAVARARRAHHPSAG